MSFLLRMATLLFATGCLVVGAQAQGKLEAHYTATLAGIPIGKGTWIVDIGDSQYTAAASGMTTGLIRLFAAGRASGAAHGTLVGGLPATSDYAATINTHNKTNEVRFSLNAGSVKDLKVEPVEVDPERVPVTDAHRKGVIDPMTASLMRVPGTGEMRGPAACERSISVFDGRLRYDLQFAYKRMEKVESDKGYIGPAVVCSLQFTPIAGFIPNRKAIKYLAKARDMEVWLAPIAGTRVMVPFRAQIHTPIGLGVIEAKQFVSSAAAPRTAKGARTQ